MKKVKIALLGFGNVGKGVWKILKENKEQLIINSGYHIEIGKILVKDMNKDRGVDIPKQMFTENFQDILKDESIDIVVEVIGGENPAKEYIVQSMEWGKHVVTANKLLLASYLEELLNIAKKHGVLLYYEASVGGGIPIIREINESLTGNKIEKITGILNGTTNYILSKMYLEGMSFEEALKESQDKGYAEADPSSDVEGDDAAFKLAIISSLAFGAKINPELICKEGITNITIEDINYAKKFGYTIKLLAVGKEENNEIEVKVNPTLIPNTHPMANINGVFNAIYIEGNAVGELMLCGKGAGELPTGSAIIGDIISILKNKSYFVKEKTIGFSCEKSIKRWEDNNSQFYIRLSVKDRPGVLGEVATIFGKNNVSIVSMTQDISNENLVSLVFTTHKSKEFDMKKSLSKIKEIIGVNKVESVLRLERFN